MRTLEKLCIVPVALALTAAPALANPAFSCGGFAMAGGAQMLCSHIDTTAPTQICTFSWALMRLSGGGTVVSGSFLLPRGISNATIYQGAGFAYALSNPIVLCQGRKGHA